MGIFPTDDPEFDAIYAEEAASLDAADVIASALETSGMSRADLARRLRVSRAEITARLRGERNITVQTLALTLHALGHTLTLTSSPAQPSKPDAEDAFVRWRRVQRSGHEDKVGHDALHQRVLASHR